MNPTTNRRVLCQSLAAGAALALSPSHRMANPALEPAPLLQRGDRLDVAGQETHIVDKAYRLGCDYEKRYGGCCQCTVAALQDAFACVTADVGLFRAASCLDGGATPTGIQNCGSFTGAGMIIGYLCGRTRDEIFFGDKTLSQELMRQLCQRFTERYGSVLCKDVRAAAAGDCPRVVGLAAQWTAEVLLTAFADYQASASASPQPKEPPPPEPADDASQGG